MEADVREAHDAPITGNKFVSASGILSPDSTSVIRVETHNMVAAVQKLFREIQSVWY